MTPLTKADGFYLKREDQNPTGSAKDRAIQLQIQYLLSQNYTRAVISSSGNAAISADYFCHQHHLNLTVFVSPKISPTKLKLIKHSQIITTPQPISSAFKFSKAHHAYNLRQSRDPQALKGYQTIGQELLSQLPQTSSLFIPVGSGTTLLGISQVLPPAVKIFAVQPASHPPIASVFDQDYAPEDSTLTTALSVKSLPLKNQVLKAAFSGLVVQNQQVKANLIDGLSPETALAVAGLKKAQKLNLNIGQFPVVLATGLQR